MKPLNRISPSAEDVDPRAILRFLDALDDKPEIELHSLMIVKNQSVITECWWTPYSPERPHMLYSLSKSFASTAAAFAVEEGLIDLDDTLASHFSEIDPSSLPSRSREITLRHVAAMASGHRADVSQESFARDLDEPVRGFLMHSPECPPGSNFAYNNPCTYALAAAVQRRAGMPLTSYLRPRLFDPLGIDSDATADDGPSQRPQSGRRDAARTRTKCPILRTLRHTSVRVGPPMNYAAQPHGGTGHR